jgi:hypothetical protein
MVVGAAGAQGCKGPSSAPHSNKNNIYIYINNFFLQSSSEMRGKKGEGRGA